MARLRPRTKGKFKGDGGGGGRWFFSLASALAGEGLHPQIPRMIVSAVPPHLDFELCSKSDLSPQAGRGEVFTPPRWGNDTP
jgi:hypothetical protein